VKLLLPAGQTEFINCTTDMTVAQLKEEFNSNAAKYKLKPMEYYVLKTTTDGFLTDETVTLYLFIHKFNYLFS
jgi:hypothetical protein